MPTTTAQLMTTAITVSSRIWRGLYVTAAVSFAANGNVVSPRRGGFRKYWTGGWPIIEASNIEREQFKEGSVPWNFDEMGMKSWRPPLHPLKKTCEWCQITVQFYLKTRAVCDWKGGAVTPSGSTPDVCMSLHPASEGSLCRGCVEICPWGFHFPKILGERHQLLCCKILTVSNIVTVLDWLLRSRRKSYCKNEQRSVIGLFLCTGISFKCVFESACKIFWQVSDVTRA